MPFILQTSGLSKKIGSKALVTDVNIHIPKGEIYGFLGPNGAGKTTVMKMITNLWKPTSGTIEMFGEVLTPKSYEVLKRMGSIIEFPTFYDHMTGRENLQLHCEYMGYYNVDSVESALQMLDLTSAADQPVKNYSLGMKERLGIARAIMCKPELLILDEPTNGLDPAGMKQIRDLLKTLCSEYGITVMISSHILSEVESIADTVAIIHHGKMMKEIRMQDIEEMNLNYVELSVTDEKRAAYVLTEKLGLQNFKILDSGKIRIYDHAASTQQLTKILALNDVEVVSIGKKSETLEDYFLKLTGEVKYIMLKLIRLEWKKNNVGKYIRNVVIMSALICLFIFALCYLGIANDPDTGVPDAVPGNSAISSSIELFTSMAFLVFTSVMLSTYIVSAYKNKTMNLMFSYPIKRQKILVSQMLAVWIFNFVALVLTKLLIYGCILLGSQFMVSSFPLDYNMASMGFYIQLLLKSVVIVTMSFIALFIGMAMKSSKATIVSSFLLIFLTQANVGDFSLADNAILPVVLMVLSLIFAFLSIYNVETKDLN